MRTGTVDGGEDALQSRYGTFLLHVSFSGQLEVRGTRDELGGGGVVWAPSVVPRDRIVEINRETFHSSTEEQAFSWYDSQRIVITSVLMRNVLNMQADGNLCLYQVTDALLRDNALIVKRPYDDPSLTFLRWQSATAGWECAAVMHDDGSLCLYGKADPPETGSFRWGSWGGPFTFNPQYYLQTYPDLKNTFYPNPKSSGADLRGLLAHWTNQGLPVQGRRGSLEFDVQFYLSTYPDLKAAFGANYRAAMDHWVRQGLPNEGRRGSRDFDVQFYLNKYPDLKASFGNNYRAALDHWVGRGFPVENRVGAPVAPVPLPGGDGLLGPSGDIPRDASGFPLVRRPKV